MANAKDQDSAQRDRMAAALRAQARICERIATECWDEDVAGTYSTMAQQCTEAAAAQELQRELPKDRPQAARQEKQDELVQARWPSGPIIPGLVS